MNKGFSKKNNPSKSRYSAWGVLWRAWLIWYWAIVLFRTFSIPPAQRQDVVLYVTDIGICLVIFLILYTRLVHPYVLMIYLDREELLRRKEKEANEKQEAEEKAREAYQEYLSLLPVEQLEQHIKQKVKEKSTTENKKEIAIWRKLHFTFSEVIGTFVFGIIIFFISLLLSVLVGRETSYAVIDDPSPFFVSYIVFVFPTMLVLWIIYHGCIRIFFQPDVLIKDVINKEIHRIKHKRFDKTRLNWEPLE